jgi:hypothetical protein
LRGQKYGGAVAASVTQASWFENISTQGAIDMTTTARSVRNLAIAFAALVSTSCCAAESVKLRVALYPFVPGKYPIFTLLAQEFQRRNEGMVVEMVEVPPPIRIIMTAACKRWMPTYMRSTPFC